MVIDFFVVDTFASISGVTALLDHADKSMPEMEWQAQKGLEELAHAEGWEYGEYDAEKQGLEADYRHWVPKYTAYSAVILLCSIAETRLLACAERIGRERQCMFRVRDLKGAPLDAASRYLKQVVGVDVTTDPAWTFLKEMQLLRNIIVHRGGLRGKDPVHRKEFDRLLGRHREGLFRSENLPFGEEVWVSIRFCKAASGTVTGFFRGLFSRLSFADSGFGIGSSTTGPTD